MFNKEDILARLQNGEDAEKIANEMIGILNAANREYVDMVEAEEARKREAAKAAARENELNARAQDMIDAVAQYIAVAYPDAQIEVSGALNVADVREMIDNVFGLTSALKDLESLLGQRTFVHRPCMHAQPVQKAAPKKKTSEEILADFLKANGLV